MASTVPFTPRPQTQFQQSLSSSSSTSSSWKPHKKPNLLSISTPEVPNFAQNPQFQSKSFPRALKLPSIHNPSPVLSPPLYDSTDENFPEKIVKLSNLQVIPDGFPKNLPGEETKRIFIQDPPWISSNRIISSENQPVRWTTPLGLPVVQPYYKTKRRVIRTSLQVLALQREDNSVDLRKQRTAFPPNCVHLLDGSHMMMTAIACRDAGICFTGVHDSFWTHACDVDRMNQILRQKFVDLYNMPILENLLESFQTSYPTLNFPPLPDRGDFDLEKVLDSPYFFN